MDSDYDDDNEELDNFVEDTQQDNEDVLIDGMVDRGCNDDEEDDVDLAFTTEDGPNLKALKLSATRMATDNCLHKYAIDRIEGAQNNTIYWPPIMLKIFWYLQTGNIPGRQGPHIPYQRTNLLNERNYAMLELLLKVPIQLRIVYSEGYKLPSGTYVAPITLDLNDTNQEGYCTTIDPNSLSFIEAKEILKDLLLTGIIQHSELRKFLTPINGIAPS
jgi:hypothetical protein